jgi:hypothetical protein
MRTSVSALMGKWSKRKTVACNTIEMDVSCEVSLRCDSLKPHGTLLLPDAQLTDHVADHPRATRLLAIASIRADRPVEFPVTLFVDAFTSDSPRSKGSVAVPRDVILCDRGVAVVTARSRRDQLQTWVEQVPPATSIGVRWRTQIGRPHCRRASPSCCSRHCTALSLAKTLRHYAEEPLHRVPSQRALD